jgi:hydroxypyruvate isomerase
MKMLSRRDIIRQTALVAAGAVVGSASAQTASPSQRKGAINQSVCQWCYSKMPVDELAQNAQRLGLKGIDLVAVAAFPTLKKYNLASTMTNHHDVNIPDGLNRKENHERILAALRTNIEANAAEGYANTICFSGNRKGMADDEGMKNCAEGLKQIVGFAEEKKVTICMELLNSKQNHKDYMCDHTEWGVALCKMVGSERFKLLYDIYHMQIDEGDVIATIRKHHEYIAHYHTGGVPGRNEIDETQELFYPAIMRAIVETGFKGIVAHEFIPKREPMKSLEAAVKLCDV